MTRLSAIRRELASLRQRRQSVRSLTALCGLGLVVLWLLGIALLIDVTLKLDLAQRAVFLALYVGVSLWAVKKYVRPWLGHRETDIDMALLVEKHQKIDSELVAALQFETTEAESWGSPYLRTAVIEYVAEYGRNWNFLEGIPTKPLKTRAALLLFTVLVAVGIVVAFPRHVGAFMQRLVLLNARYPSQTRIVATKLHSELGDLNLRDGGYRGPFGQKVTFEFQVEGVFPNDGRLEMLSEGERRAPLTIKRQGEPHDGIAVYEATLDRLLKPVQFQAFLHDTWTDPQDLTVIPTPIVELELSATAPEYARGIVASEAPTRERQISVLQGSTVHLQVRCPNKKLKEAKLFTRPAVTDPAASKAEWVPITLTTVKAGQADVYTLPATDSPLGRVVKETQYKVEIVDEDGLTADGEIAGTIRVKLDRKPTVTALASAGTTRVLPAAKPKFDINVGDDFALAKLAAHIEVQRQVEGSGVVEPPSDGRPDQADIQIPLENAPLLLRDSKLPYNLQKYTIPLEAFKLTKGDQLKIYFEATDFRGPDTAGESTRSDAITLTVTDDSGIIAGITERDELGVRQIDEINKTQLGTGGSK